MDVVLASNGVYDLACAASILWFNNTLSKLHPTMFSRRKHYENPVIKRLMAYWLMTYGMVRLIAGFSREKNLYLVAAMTYFIEAFCFEYENRIGHTMVTSKVTFVSTVSVLIGIWITTLSFSH
jgi:prolipoprotein diacylglyceryltransferase